MRFDNRCSILPVMAAALAIFGCSAARHSAPETAQSGSTAELEAIYRARIDSARNRYVEADVAFITGMISHHAQAIVMSRLAPTHQASPTILTLTGRIINAQQDEIALMQQWLRERKLPVPELHFEGTNVMVHGSDHRMMPGMLTPEQLKQLDQARGREFDRLFLTFMIQHHRGAVTMVRDLFAAGGAGRDDSVFKLASDVQADQTTEIARMEQMLAALSREP
jgi:uncharacterized protein (DUF305 family)